MNDASTTTPPKAARWEDYIDVFFSPRELFERRAGDRLLPPLLALLAAGVLMYIITLPVNRMVMESSMANQPPEAAEAAQQFGIIFLALGGLVVPIFMFITVTFAAFLLWGIGQTFGAELGFGDAMLIATYAAFVYLIAQLLAGVIILVTGAETVDPVRDMSFGVLRFIGTGDTDGSLAAVLRRFDIFAIWQAILWGLGVMIVGRVSKGRAILIAALAWILYAVPGVIVGALDFGTPPGA